MKAQYIGKAQIVLLAIMILLGCILICSASECGVAAAERCFALKTAAAAGK